MVGLLVDPFLEQFWVRSDIERKVQTLPMRPAPTALRPVTSTGCVFHDSEGLGSQAGRCEVGRLCSPTRSAQRAPVSQEGSGRQMGSVSSDAPTCTQG